MKKVGLMIVAVVMILMMASVGFAGPRHGGHHHGGHWHGGFGFYGVGFGIGIAAPGVVIGAYPAACATRCYNRVVPSCSYTIEGTEVCSNTIVRTCGSYCY